MKTYRPTLDSHPKRVAKRSPDAKALELPLYRQRVKPSKPKHIRKPKYIHINEGRD